MHRYVANFLCLEQSKKHWKKLTLYWENVVYRPNLYVSNDVEEEVLARGELFLAQTKFYKLCSVVMTKIHVAGDIINKLSIFNSRCSKKVNTSELVATRAHWKKNINKTKILETLKKVNTLISRQTPVLFDVNLERLNG